MLINEFSHRLGRRNLPTIPVLRRPAKRTPMTNWNGLIRFSYRTGIIMDEGYLNNDLSGLSIRDQDVDSIVRRLGGPPVVDVGAEHGEKFGGSEHSVHLGWAEEPRDDEGN